MLDKIEAVEGLREKLKQEYPALEKISRWTESKNFKPKARRSYDLPVRSTISSETMNSIAKNSSKFVRMKDMNFPASPTNHDPISIRTQEWEVVNSLDCFLKHISPKAYQKYIAENVPCFEKSIKRTVKFPNIEEKPRKVRGVSLNEANLELLGQKEVSNEFKKLEKRNLVSITKRINRDIKRWCITLATKPDPEAQLIDHHTYKIKKV